MEEEQEEVMKLEGGSVEEKSKKLEGEVGSRYGHLSLNTGMKFPKNNLSSFFLCLKNKTKNT